jgi:hypothetical protein
MDFARELACFPLIKVVLTFIVQPIHPEKSPG